MSEFLLVDFGASRVKSLLFDSTTFSVVDKEECISPSIHSSSSIVDRFEIPIEKYWHALLETVGKIILRHPEKNIKQLWICSEMHGFVLSHPNGNAITPYISWKDQRANYDDIDGQSSFEKLNTEFHHFRTITGMHLKSGLPVLTLASGCMSGSIPELKSLPDNACVRVLSLVDWLLFRGGEVAPKANISLAAGLGFYDIYKRTVSQEILKSIYFNSIKISGLDIQNDLAEPLGRIRIFDSEILVYGGIGDFQAAIEGSGFLKNFTAALNLGTGSQAVVRIAGQPLSNNDEVRIMTDGSFVNVITHIPCGRALNVFASFLNSFSGAGGGKDVFWKIWSSLPSEAIVNSKLVSNLALFKSAWGREFSDNVNGSIGLDEGVDSVTDVMAGIAKSWVLQYSKALHQLDPLIKAKEVIISGGVGQKSQFLIPVLKYLMPERNFYLSALQTTEETFDGLVQLAISNQQKVIN